MVAQRRQYHWTMPTIARVRGMSAHGLSDRDIVGALMVYEEITVTIEQIKRLRHTHGISKPSSEIRRAQAIRLGSERNLRFNNDRQEET